MSRECASTLDLTGPDHSRCARSPSRCARSPRRDRVRILVGLRVARGRRADAGRRGAARRGPVRAAPAAVRALRRAAPRRRAPSGSSCRWPAPTTRRSTASAGSRSGCSSRCWSTSCWRSRPAGSTTASTARSSGSWPWSRWSSTCRRRCWWSSYPLPSPVTSCDAGCPGQRVHAHRVRAGRHRVLRAAAAGDPHDRALRGGRRAARAAPVQREPPHAPRPGARAGRGVLSPGGLRGRADRAAGRARLPTRSTWRCGCSRSRCR